MKLWRGPHRAGLNSPWPTNGGDVNQMFPSAQHATADWGPLRYECEYVREWSEVTYIAMLGWPDSTAAVFLQPGPQADPTKAYLYRVQKLLQPQQPGDEMIVCWFFENEKHVQKEAFWKHQWKAFLLSNQRRVFSYESWYANGLVSQVDLSQIEDVALRDCIQRELNQLP